MYEVFYLWFKFSAEHVRVASKPSDHSRDVTFTDVSAPTGAMLMFKGTGVLGLTCMSQWYHNLKLQLRGILHSIAVHKQTHAVVNAAYVPPMYREWAAAESEKMLIF